jgi:hypothetical protein
MSLSRIKRTIPKKMKPIIQEIAEDSECFEVILKDGYWNPCYGETMWVFGKHYLEDMSVSEMIDEFELWIDGVEAEEAA